jgi:hypothetical protein
VESQSVQQLHAEAFSRASVRKHRFPWGYTWTKLFLQSKGLLEKAKPRGAHRRKRPRRPLPGMMLHQDGSRHNGMVVIMDKRDKRDLNEASNGHGRDGRFQPPPVQIPASATNAPGSSLGSWRRNGDRAAGVKF